MGNKKNNSLLLYNSSKDDLTNELYSFEKSKGFCHEQMDSKAYDSYCCKRSCSIWYKS